MKPHALRGTAGAEVIDELIPHSTDIIVPKRRFSAFFKTDLDMTLRGLGIDTIVVGGISTEVCIMTTALDGIAYDFKAIILSDCCASYSGEVRDKVLSIYQKTPLYPLFQIMSLNEFISSLG
jgi:nicotinamidase-related amidase